MILTEHAIYPIATGVHFGRQPEDVYLIYAPLSGQMLLADAQTVYKMNRTLEGEKKEEEVDELLTALLDTSDNPLETIHHLEDYQVMYVLPGFLCNFSCSYCFSARGRSGKELSWPQLKAALDYFVDSRRSQKKELKITFVGGGEPMLSWRLVKSGIEYASELAGRQGIALYFGLITNGSVMNEEILRTFSTYHVRPRLSFEILEEIQNKQRGAYRKVCQTLDALSAREIPCEVRSMITPANVDRLGEMVLEMVHRFPAVATYYFDPITDARIFSDPEYTRRFYHRYNEAFLQARTIAKAHQKELKNATSRSLETTVERYCNGELCLTPEGTFSICMEVSSPEEKHYEEFIYGWIDENHTVRMDREKFRRLKEKEMAQQNPDCLHCFARWNCGGGCMASNNQYSYEVRQVICDATRSLTHRLLLERLHEEYLSQSGITLEELVNNYMD